MTISIKELLLGVAFCIAAAIAVVVEVSLAVATEDAGARTAAQTTRASQPVSVESAHAPTPSSPPRRPEER